MMEIRDKTFKNGFAIIKIGDFGHHEFECFLMKHDDEGIFPFSSVAP